MKKTVKQSSNTEVKQTIDAKSFYETRSFLVFSLGIFIVLNVATTLIVSIFMANTTGNWLLIFGALVFVDVLICVYLILAFIKMPNPVVKKEIVTKNIEGKPSVKDILDNDEINLKEKNAKAVKSSATVKPKTTKAKTTTASAKTNAKPVAKKVATKKAVAKPASVAKKPQTATASKKPVSKQKK